MLGTEHHAAPSSSDTPVKSELSLMTLPLAAIPPYLSVVFLNLDGLV